MTKFSGSLFTITNGLYNSYLQNVEEGYTTLSFSEFEDEYFENHTHSTTLRNRMRNLNRHLESKDALKQRLRQKLAKRKNKK